MLEFLNGKKTTFGMIAMLISLALGFPVTEGQIATVLSESQEIAESIGIIMGVIGLAHKGFKASRS